MPDLPFIVTTQITHGPASPCWYDSFPFWGKVGMGASQANGGFFLSNEAARRPEKMGIIVFPPARPSRRAPIPCLPEGGRKTGIIPCELHQRLSSYRLSHQNRLLRTFYGRKLLSIQEYSA